MHETFFAVGVVPMAKSLVGADVAGLLSWWGHELRGLLPGGSDARDAATTRLVLSVEPDGLQIAEPPTGRAGRLPAPEGTVPVAAMMAYLAGVAQHLKSPKSIGLRLPYSACFVRRLELPAVARRDFARLLALELERSTPFKVKDVWTAHDIDPSPAAKGSLKVRHLIIKRKPIEGLLSQIRALGLTVTRVECTSDDGASVIPLNFLGAPAADDKPEAAGGAFAFALALWLAAAALAGSAAYIYIDRHEKALQLLQSELDGLKLKAQVQKDALARSQAAFSQIANVQKLRSETVSKVAILEELSRILPDTAWVTDFKLDGTTVDISGLAVSAASLVPILERSKVFVDATSTASLTFDAREEKERYAIRVRIRTAAAPVGRAEGDAR